MNAFSALRHGSLLAATAFATVFAGAAVAHEGHGATPAHVHVGGGFPVDVGAAIVIAVIGVAALVSYVRARR